MKQSKAKTTKAKTKSTSVKTAKGRDPVLLAFLRINKTLKPLSDTQRVKVMNAVAGLHGLAGH
jgi:hypothetical protein